MSVDQSNESSSHLSFNLASPTSSSYSMSTSEDESDNEIDFNKLFKLEKRGKSWELLKPINNDNLYYQIVHSNNPEDVILMVEDYFDENKFLYSMIRLILDLADFQHIDVPMKETYGTASILKIIKMIDAKGPKHMETPNLYLMNNTTKVAQAIMYRLFRFLNLMVQNVEINEKITHAQFFKFIFVLKELSQSQMLSARHTCVVFCIKMMSNIVVILENSHCQEVLYKYFKILFTVFDKNCTLNCYKLYRMRAQCILECEVWASRLPEFRGKCLDRIRRCTVDSHNHVRHTALTVINLILGRKHLRTFLQPKIGDYTKYAEGRLKDVDAKVRLSAINVCTTVLQMYDHTFTAESMNLLKMMVLDKNASIGIAASNFYVSDLMKQNNHEADVINKFLVYVKQNISLLPVIVEGVLPTFPLFQDFETMFALFKQNVLWQEDIFVRVILQCAFQLIAGKSPMPREGSESVSLHKKRLVEICSIVLDNIPNILKKLKGNPDCLNEIENFLSSLIQNDMTSINICGKIDAIQTLLESTYLTTTDISCIDSVSKILFQDFNNDYPKNERNRVKPTIIEKFISSYKTFNGNTPKNELQGMNLIYTKFLYLLTNIDVHSRISYDLLLNHFDHFTRETPKDFAKTVIEILRHYLKWKSNDYVTKLLLNANFKQELEEYYTKLLDVFSKTLQSDIIQHINMSFCNSLLNILIDYKKGKKESEGKVTAYFQFSLNENVNTLLLDYVVLCLFQNPTGSMEIRKNLLKNYIEAVLRGQIPYKYFVKLLTYYNNSKFYDEVFVAAFEIIKPKTQIICVAEAITLAVRENIQSRVTNERSELFTNILKLAAKLIDLISCQEYLSLLEFSINIAHKSKEYELLIFFTTAIKRLSSDDCIKLLSVTSKLFQDNTNVYVTKFLNTINEHYSSEPVKNRKKLKSN